MGRSGGTVAATHSANAVAMELRSGSACDVDLIAAEELMEGRAELCVLGGIRKNPRFLASRVPDDVSRLPCNPRCHENPRRCERGGRGCSRARREQNVGLAQGDSEEVADDHALGLAQMDWLHESLLPRPRGVGPRRPRGSSSHSSPRPRPRGRIARRRQADDPSTGSRAQAAGRAPGVEGRPAASRSHSLGAAKGGR